MLCVSPEVSICVPVYNAEKYIYSSLKSIVKQRYDISKLKIIIINDGSTDNSLSKIEQFSKDFPKLDITVVSQENKGLNKTRYELFKLVSTEYFVFMDADDFLTKNAIRNLTSVLNENSDMVLSRMKGNLGPFTFYMDPKFKKKELSCMFGVNKHIKSSGNKMYSTKFYMKTFENYVFNKDDQCEDMAANFLVFMNAENIEYSNKINYTYMLRLNSMSNNVSPEKFHNKFKELMNNFYNPLSFYFKKTSYKEISDEKKEFVRKGISFYCEIATGYSKKSKNYKEKYTEFLELVKKMKDKYLII